jgi:hypothetical protein
MEFIIILNNFEFFLRTVFSLGFSLSYNLIIKNLNIIYLNL